MDKGRFPTIFTQSPPPHPRLPSQPPFIVSQVWETLETSIASLALCLLKGDIECSRRIYEAMATPTALVLPISRQKRWLRITPPLCNHRLNLETTVASFSLETRLQEAALLSRQPIPVQPPPPLLVLLALSFLVLS